jgi:hypothetical protein
MGMGSVQGKIKVEDIDAFDIQFEKDREEGKHTEDEEPGDGPQAPYHWGHQLATSIERIAAFTLGVSWQEYENEVISL